MRFDTEREAACYLAGMIDGEGHVRHGLKQDGTRTASRYKAIQITNTDTELLNACEEACELIGVEYKRHQKVREGSVGNDGHNRKACYVTWILGKENLERVHDIVPIQSPQKKEALRIAITSYVDKEELGKRISEGRRLGKEKRIAEGLPLRSKK